jgi:NADH-quinone oxidoreductase subunit M
MMTGIGQFSTLATAATGGEVLLPLLLLVPVVGALVVALIKDASLARTTALGVALATLVLSVLLVLKTDLGMTSTASHTLAHQWAAPAMFSLGDVEGSTAFRLSLFADAIGVWLVALTCVLVPCAMLATREGVERASSYFAWMLLLQASCLGAFISGDLLLFYFFFELTLVPSFFLIGQWGGVERRHAAVKFFVFTFAGSLFMLASILYVVLKSGTFDITDAARFVQTSMTPGERLWVLLGLLIGLGVKVPLLPLHTWLPITYTQAPAPVTALLSGVLAKLGTYGLLRLAIPMGLISVEADGYTLLSWIVALSVLAIIYAALVAWTQRDYKTLLAYSSVSHLGFCVLALACLNTMGGQASVLYMVNHGISTAALFFMLGMIEYRTGTRSIEQISGLGKERPLLAFFFVLFVMSSIGLPLTNGFVSEFLSLQATVTKFHILVTILAATGVVLGAIYMLHLTAKLIFGPVRMPAEAGTPRDLNFREVMSLAPLALLVIGLGVMPNLVLNSIKVPVAALMTGATSPAVAPVATSTNVEDASVARAIEPSTPN